MMPENYDEGQLVLGFVCLEEKGGGKENREWRMQYRERRKEKGGEK